MATTGSSTFTFTRIDAVKLQFKHSLCYATDIDEKYIALLLECIENHYIEGFHFYGLNTNNQCEIELDIKIDWSEFQIAVSMDENVCFTSGRHHNGVSMVIYDWIENYLKVVNGRGLKKDFSFTYSSKVRNDRVLHAKVVNRLNSHPVPPVVYAPGFKLSQSIPVFDLPEMSMQFKCRE